MAAPESNLEFYKAQQQAELEVFKSVVQTGQAALRTALLINGGAAVALLAFIGNIWSRTPPVQSAAAVIGALAGSLLSFTGGVLLGAIATGTTYLTQVAFQYNWKKTGEGLRVFTILLVVCALGAFAVGVWTTYTVFRIGFPQSGPMVGLFTVLLAFAVA